MDWTMDIGHADIRTLRAKKKVKLKRKGLLIDGMNEGTNKGGERGTSISAQSSHQTGWAPLTVGGGELFSCSRPSITSAG